MSEGNAGNENITGELPKSPDSTASAEPLMGDAGGDSRYLKYGWTPEQVQMLREAGALDAAVAAAERAAMTIAERLEAHARSPGLLSTPTAAPGRADMPGLQQPSPPPRMTRKALAEHLDRINRELAEIKTRYAAEQQQKLAAEVEQYFNKLGDEWADVYGRGPYHALAPQQRFARDEVVRAAALLASAYPGETVPDLLERARYAQHGGLLYGHAAKRAASDIAKAKAGQYLSSAPGRSKSLASGEERAARLADQLVSKLRAEG